MEGEFPLQDEKRRVFPVVEPGLTFSKLRSVWQITEDIKSIL